MPRAGRRVLPRVGALIEGPAALRPPVRPGEPGAARTPRARAARGAPGRRRIDEVLEQVGLAGVGRRPVKAYSLGMRQRLGLAGALLRRPELLVLDEPTNGLDPQGIAEIRELLLDLNRGGTTVFLSSHLLAEVEQLCTRVGVLDRGRLVLQDELATLTAPDRRHRRRAPRTRDRVRAALDGRVTSIDGDRVVVRGGDPAEVNALLVGAGVPVTGLAAGAADASRRWCWPRPAPAPTGSTRRRAVAPVIVVELRKLFRRPRTWATIGAAQRAADRSSRCCWRSPTWRRGRGEGPAFLSAVLHQRRAVPAGRAGASCCRCSCRSPSPSSPVTRSPARRRPARCATCWPGRPAAPGCWWPSWSSVLAFVLVTVLIVAVVGYVVGPLLFDAQPLGAGTVGVRAPRSPRSSSPAARCWPSATSRCRCSGWPPSRCSSPRSPTRRSARRWARWRCWSRRRCCSPWTPRRRSRPTCRPGTGSRSSTSSATRSCGGTSSAGSALQARLRRRAAGRGLGELHHQGHHQLIRASALSSALSQARAVGGGQLHRRAGRELGQHDPCTSGSRGRSPWATRASAHTDCTGRFSAPSSRRTPAG